MRVKELMASPLYSDIRGAGSAIAALATPAYERRATMCTLMSDTMLIDPVLMDPVILTYGRCC